MREVTAELGIGIPDYLTNRDVYQALNRAGTRLEEAHIEVYEMIVYGLELNEMELADPPIPEHIEGTVMLDEDE